MSGAGSHSGVLTSWENKFKWKGSFHIDVNTKQIMMYELSVYRLVLQK